MTTIRTFLGIFLIGLTALWGWTDTTAWASLLSISAWRWPLLQWTGVMAMGVMALALVLAVRPVVFEGFFGGLDKMYRLHKWLGIAALAWSVAHWLAEDLPKERRPRPKSGGGPFCKASGTWPRRWASRPSTRSWCWSCWRW